MDTQAPEKVPYGRGTKLAATCFTGVWMGISFFVAIQPDTASIPPASAWAIGAVTPLVAWGWAWIMLGKETPR